MPSETMTSALHPKQKENGWKCNGWFVPQSDLHAASSRWMTPVSSQLKLKGPWHFKLSRDEPRQCAPVGSIACSQRAL